MRSSRLDFRALSKGLASKPARKSFIVLCRARLGGVECGLIPPHPAPFHRELAGKRNLGLLHPGPLRKLQRPGREPMQFTSLIYYRYSQSCRTNVDYTFPALLSTAWNRSMGSLAQIKADLTELAERLRVAAETLKRVPSDRACFLREVNDLREEVQTIATRLRED